MIDCTHDLAERETACADGFCPICLQRELAKMRERRNEWIKESCRLGGMAEQRERELAEARHAGREIQVALESELAAYKDAATARDRNEDEMRRELAEARGLLREYATDALDDLNNWSGYASEYFQEKHDLEGDRKKWLTRIAATDV